jgi:hypothetical protein
MIAGIEIVLAFAFCAGLMIARLVPALVAVPLLALLMGAAAGVGTEGLSKIVVDGSVALAAVYATVIFGAVLGRVTMETGIAEAIVNYAAEFGGDQPMWLALVLCAAVALLFTSLTGLGAIIMVGSIVLPIMMTTGVPRSTAATLFLLAFALGFIFNIAQWTFYTNLFGVEPGALQRFAVVLFVIQAFALGVFAFVRSRRMRDYATWAIAAEGRDEALERARGVPVWSLVTPVLPLALYVFAHANALVAFAIAALYGVLASRPRRAIKVLVASAIRGVEDVAPAVLLMMGIGMLLVAARTPQVQSALATIVAPFAPRNPLAYVILFGVFSPLALYRGPLNPYGVGIGVYAVLLTLHVMSPVALVAAVMAVVQVQNVCDPTNTQNVWVANYTGVRVDQILRLTLPYQTAVATVACILFASLAPANAQERAALQGLYAPPAARDVVAVGSDGTQAAATGATAIRRALDGTLLRPIAAQGDPAARDCSTKPYAAYLRVASDHAQTLRGTIVDLGIQLLDCAGWPIDQWWEQRIVPRLDTSVADQMAAAALDRMWLWSYLKPDLAQALFSRGLAFIPGKSEPTYFYSLFKSDDGNMRAWVRPGGPAYAAGMRTNDVVWKIDGKWWWEYGTYPTQNKAYDGQPHTFNLARPGDPNVVVTLGAPLR